MRLLNALLAFIARLGGVARKMAGFIVKAYSLGGLPVVEQQTVCFRSRRHGLRFGRVVRYDNSGRVVIQLDDHPKGVRVRRQRHMLAVI